MSERGALVAGAALMGLLGIARGAGALLLLVRGASSDPRIQATAGVVAGIGAVLLLIGVGLVASAIGVLRRFRTAWWAGIALAVAFVIDGAVNGTVLYGKPGRAGTVANVVVASVIVALLLRGRAALRSRASSDGERGNT